MIKEFRRMPFIWAYQRPLTKKRHRVPITVKEKKKKSWVHWNIIQECWHTGNSQILLPLLFEMGPIWILFKSYSFKSIMYSINLQQIPHFILTPILHPHPVHPYRYTHVCTHIHMHTHTQTHTDLRIQITHHMGCRSPHGSQQPTWQNI